MGAIRPPRSDGREEREASVCGIFIVIVIWIRGGVPAGARSWFVAPHVSRASEGRGRHSFHCRQLLQVAARAMAGVRPAALRWLWVEASCCCAGGRDEAVAGEGLGAGGLVGRLALADPQVALGIGGARGSQVRHGNGRKRII